jgi:hypothetical protein
MPGLNGSCRSGRSKRTIRNASHVRSFPRQLELPKSCRSLGHPKSRARLWKDSPHGRMMSETTQMGGSMRQSRPRFGALHGAAKPEERPAPRKPAYEQMLCEAIRTGMAVELRYQKADERPDSDFRKFGPDAVYNSEKDKTCVSGEQLNDRPTPRNFEIGRIVDLRISDQVYRPSNVIDYTQEKYRNGILCRR